jgi:transposase
MLNYPSTEEIYISAKHVDMRKSFDGLALYIQQGLDKNPLTGKWFVFFNRNYNKVKIFYWDSNGPCFWYKRLEQGVFRPPRIKDKVYTINSHELNLLLEGIDLTNKQRFGIVPVSTVN